MTINYEHPNRRKPINYEHPNRTRSAPEPYRLKKGESVSLSELVRNSSKVPD